MTGTGRPLLASLPLMGRGLGLVWGAARGWTLAWGLLLLVQGLIPVAMVWLMRGTVNLLTSALSGPAPGPGRVWPPVLAMGLLALAGQAAASLMAWVRTAQAERVQDHLHGLIHGQALALDLAFFEDPDSFDLLHRARVDAITQPVALLESLGSLVQSALTLAALMVLLAAYTLWLPALLLATALPGLWAVGRVVLREHQWRVANTANERRVRYLDWMLTERGSAAEMRLFALGAWHREAFQQARARLRAGRLALALGALRADLAAGTAAWAGGLGGMALMLLRALRGLARLGDLVLCYQAFLQGQKLLRTLLESAGQIYRSSLFLENLFQFLALRPALAPEPSARPVPHPLVQGIRLEDISFSYPGSGSCALRDFSLSLPAGRVTAIVGANGAGKSTLIKLLCRFYDPQAGRILLDGHRLQAYDLDQLRRRITVLFQEPVHYHATAGQNIAMGDLASAPDPGRIRRAARAAGAAGPVERLPQGYDTLLGKWFGGAELSVGEWQRLALARAFLRDAGLVVLDEPTSAMDSWAEADWLGRFRELTAGRTALIITHRFTTAMHADRIHVMDAGRVVESGTHGELVAAGGRYAGSWRAQMREARPCGGES
jgi:ATP-binding cassette subfamily B protein